MGTRKLSASSLTNGSFPPSTGHYRNGGTLRRARPNLRVSAPSIPLDVRYDTRDVCSRLIEDVKLRPRPLPALVMCNASIDMIATMASYQSPASLTEALLTLWDCYSAALAGGEHEAVQDALISKMDELVPHGTLSDLLFWGERERTPEEAIREAVHREVI